jgi:chromosomal replication initiation ATPase DnaA
MSLSKRISLDHDTAVLVANLIERKLGVGFLSLEGRDRSDYISWARGLYCLLLRRYTNLSTTFIGSLINRDHSTVIHLSRVAADLVFTQYRTCASEYAWVVACLHAGGHAVINDPAHRRRT